MQRRIRELLRLPAIGVLSAARRAAMLNALIRASLTLGWLLIGILMLVQPGYLWPWIMGGSGYALAIIAWVFIKRNHLRAAGLLYAGANWLFLTAVALRLTGSPHDVPIEAYFFLIVLVGSWLGVQTSYLVASLSMATSLWVIWLSGAGFVESSLALGLHTMLYALALGIVNIAGPIDGQVMAQAEQNQRELQEVKASLEERVESRTAEILYQKQFYEALVDVSPIAVITLDDHHHITHCNKAFEELFGYSLREIIGREVDDIITTPETRNEAEANTFAVLSGTPIRKTGQRRRKDGSLVEVEIYGMPVNVDGTHVGALALYRDITAQLQAMQRLEYLATHDPLTGLPNRALFFDRLQHAIELANRNRSGLAVIFLDLDNFKVVNDSYGHEAGDSLLQAMGKRLKQACRQSDTVARMGGDEFTLILEHTNAEANVDAVVAKVHEVLSAPFVVEGTNFTITASLGCALYPADGRTVDELVRVADAAMYRMKGHEIQINGELTDGGRE